MYSLETASLIKNDIWIKNAAILVAQIETIRGYKEEALKNYEIAESAARRLNDQRTLFSIVCETTKLGKKLRRPKIDDGISKMTIKYRRIFCRKALRAQSLRVQSSTNTLRRPRTLLNNYLTLKKPKLIN